MTVSLSLFAGAGWQFFDNNGNVLSGGLLYTYEAGTTTPLATYTSSTGATANTNPIVLNAGGRPANEIWLDVSKTAKFILKDSLGSTIGTWDNIPSIVSALNLSGTNNGVPYFNAGGVFSSGSNLTFDGTNLSVSGNVTTGADADIGGNANVSGNATVTGNASVSGNATVTGTIASTGGLTSTTPAVTQALGDASTKVATTAFVNNAVSASATKSKIQTITVDGPSGGILTITLAPTTLDFRNYPTTTGLVSTVSNTSSISLTLTGAETLGATSGVATRLVVLAINNAGAMELAINNIAGGIQLDETNIINTLAITSGTTDTAVYSTTARTNVAYRVVGFIDVTNTGGNWGSPTTVQGIGGEPLAAMSSIGYGQTYNSFTDPGVSTPTYNTSGKPQFMTCVITCPAGSGNMAITCNGVTIANIFAGNATAQGSAFWIVPVGASWQYTVSGSALNRTFVRLS